MGDNEEFRSLVTQGGPGISGVPFFSFLSHRSQPLQPLLAPCVCTPPCPLSSPSHPFAGLLCSWAEFNPVLLFFNCRGVLCSVGQGPISSASGHFLPCSMEVLNCMPAPSAALLQFPHVLAREWCRKPGDRTALASSPGACVPVVWEDPGQL